MQVQFLTMRPEGDKVKIFYNLFGDIVKAFEETIIENWDEVEKFRNMDAKALSTKQFEYMMMSNMMRKTNGHINPKLIQQLIGLEFSI